MKVTIDGEPRCRERVPSDRVFGKKAFDLAEICLCDIVIWHFDVGYIYVGIGIAM